MRTYAVVIDYLWWFWTVLGAAVVGAWWSAWWWGRGRGRRRRNRRSGSLWALGSLLRRVDLADGRQRAGRRKEQAGMRVRAGETGGIAHGGQVAEAVLQAAGPDERARGRCGLAAWLACWLAWPARAAATTTSWSASAGWIPRCGACGLGQRRWSVAGAGADGGADAATVRRQPAARDQRHGGSNCRGDGQPRVPAGGGQGAAELRLRQSATHRRRGQPQCLAPPCGVVCQGRSACGLGVSARRMSWVAGPARRCCTGTTAAAAGEAAAATPGPLQRSVGQRRTTSSRWGPPGGFERWNGSSWSRTTSLARPNW